eukprot:9475466-Pyramimonas_sp.AAC.1
MDLLGSEEFADRQRACAEAAKELRQAREAEPAVLEAGKRRYLDAVPGLGIKRARRVSPS